MLRVGLTGGIGCGKTTVSNLFAELGVSIIDTDVIAHQITQPDGPAFQAVINTFGIDILSTDGTINRKQLANIIFNSEEKKKQLESLLHPLIWIIVEEHVFNSQSPYSIIVVPLLFEGQHQARFNSTLLVHCTEEDQINRVKARDQRSENDIKAIMDSQISSNEKLKLCDQSIQNTGEINTLRAEVKRLHQIYLEQSAI